MDEKQYQIVITDREYQWITTSLLLRSQQTERQTHKLKLLTLTNKIIDTKVEIEV